MARAEVVPELAVPADVPSLAVTCAAAFNDDAMIRWPMPEATPAVLQELFRVILEPYVEFGVLWKIGGCDGGAAWLPPGVAGRFDEIEQSARAAINPLTDDGGVRYATFWDWLGAHLPGEPCWFLDLVAVAPAAQGRGLGRRLVMHGLDLARADGCPAFLETSTPRNVPFYQSLGFQIVEEQRAPDGGPMIWFMQAPRLPEQVPQRRGRAREQDHPAYIHVRSGGPRHLTSQCALRRSCAESHTQAELHLLITSRIVARTDRAVLLAPGPQLRQSG